MSQRSLGVWSATALVVGNMVGVGVLLTPRLVAAALPELWGFLGLWLLGGLIALSGAAVYAELGARFPEAGGDVAFQDAGLGRAWALGSGVLMFVAAFAASIAAISVAIGTWQVPTLLGLPTPDEGWLSRGVGLGVIGLLTAVNLAGLRAGAAVQVLTTALPVVGLALLALWALLTGQAPPPEATTPAPAEAGAGGLVSAFSGVYFAYAGWPAVVYLAGEVRAPSRTLPRAMLGGTALVTGLYLLLNLAFARTLGMGGLQGTFEAGSALAGAVLGEGAGWLMAALVLAALLASVNATVLGGARVALALGRRGALPAVFAQTDAAGVPRAALLLQAALAAALVLSGTFDQIVEGSVLAMLVIGSLTVLSLVLIRRRPAAPTPGYSASLWPLPAALYLLVSAGVLGLGVYDALAGEGGAHVLIGLALLVGAALVFRLRAPTS